MLVRYSFDVESLNCWHTALLIETKVMVEVVLCCAHAGHWGGSVLAVYVVNLMSRVGKHVLYGLLIA